MTFFRNATAFLFPPSVTGALATLTTAIAERPLRPCGPLELATHGFISPYGRDDSTLVQAHGSYSLVAIGGEERMLPAVVVNEALAAKIDEIKAKEGRHVGGKERRRLKDEIVTTLLPRAFIRPSRRSAYFDAKTGWFIVDSASPKAAEDVVSQVRDALGRFPAIPLMPDTSVAATLTSWLVAGEPPAPFAFGGEIELREPADGGGTWRGKRQDLESDEVKEHLKAGKHVTQLELVYNERIAFVLTETLVLKKLQFLDVVLNQLEDEAAETTQAELDACFALMTLELAPLFATLAGLFGLQRPEDAEDATP